MSTTKNDNRPLLSMTKKEMDETFMELGSDIDRGMLGDARAGGYRSTAIVATVLCMRDGHERLVVAYEEYGDEANRPVCEGVMKGVEPFLHAGESLRIATYEIDLSLAVVFTFPSERMLKRKAGIGRDEGWRRYGMLHEARGELTVLVTWLVLPGGDVRKLFTWDIDHGDTTTMEENVQQTLKSVEHNKLLKPGEKLEVVAYTVPLAALREVSVPAGES